MRVRFCPACLTEVEEHSEVCRNCGTPRPEEAWPLTSETRYPWLGEVIAERYRLRQYIGYGATGEVYRAEAMSTSRSFAVKVIARAALPRQLDFEELRARLFREVAILGGIRSPYIISIVDFVELPQDVFVMVMELAGGVTLERMIFDQHRLPLIRALEITEQLLEALAEIHEQGIVHRDLKPENIVVRSLRSGRPFIQLLDFGVAKLYGEPNVTHGFVGTPLFASPEQIRNAEITDQRTDLYACGCILFNLLAGFPPFRAERGAEVMRMHLTMEPPQLPLRTGSAELDRLLDEFIGRALEKDPEKRFSTATQMLASPLFDMGRNYALLRAPADAFDDEPETTLHMPEPEIPEDLDPRSTHVASPKVSVTSGLIRGSGVAISSSGDMGACVLSGGTLLLCDLVRDEVIAKMRLGPSVMPPDLHFMEERQVLAVVHPNGRIQILETSDLSTRVSLASPAKRVLWSARAATRADVLLLMERERIISLDIETGQTSVTEFEKPLESAPLTTQQPWGWLAFDPATGQELVLQESAHGCTVRASGTGVVLEPGERVHDVREDGALLVEKEGVYFETGRDASSRRVLVRTAGIRWAFAHWLTSESLLAVSEDGALHLLVTGAAPKLLNRSIQRLCVSDDRSAACMLTGEDALEVWRPERKGQTGSMPAAHADASTSGLGAAPGNLVWHFSPITRQIVQAREGTLFRSEGKGWTLLAEPTGAPAVALQVLPQSGAVAWSDAQGKIDCVAADGCRRGWQVEESQEVTRLACSEALDFFSIGLGKRKIVTLRSRRRDPSKLVRMWSRELSSEITSMSMMASGGLLVVGGADGSIHLLDLSSGSIRASVPASGGRVDSLAISPDGHMMVALRSGERVELYDTHAVRIAYRAQLPRAGAAHVAFRDDGEIVAGYALGEGIEVRVASTDTLMFSEKQAVMDAAAKVGTGS